MENPAKFITKFSLKIVIKIFTSRIHLFFCVSVCVSMSNCHRRFMIAYCVCGTCCGCRGRRCTLHRRQTLSHRAHENRTYAAETDKSFPKQLFINKQLFHLLRERYKFQKMVYDRLLFGISLFQPLLTLLPLPLLLLYISEACRKNYESIAAVFLWWISI